MSETRARYATRRQSYLERLFEAQLQEAGMPAPVSEHRFHPVRKWRFDYAFPNELLAVEIEGGAYSRGRHTRGAGFTEDCVKYNEATLLGWRVLRFTGEQVNDGSAIEYTVMALRRFSE